MTKKQTLRLSLVATILVVLLCLVAITAQFVSPTAAYADGITVSGIWYNSGEAWEASDVSYESTDYDEIYIKVFDSGVAYNFFWETPITRAVNYNASSYLTVKIYDSTTFTDEHELVSMETYIGMLLVECDDSFNMNDEPHSNLYPNSIGNYALILHLGEYGEESFRALAKINISTYDIYGPVDLYKTKMAFGSNAESILGEIFGEGYSGMADYNSSYKGELVATLHEYDEDASFHKGAEIASYNGKTFTGLDGKPSAGKYVINLSWTEDETWGAGEDCFDFEITKVNIHQTFYPADFSQPDGATYGSWSIPNPFPGSEDGTAEFKWFYSKDGVKTELTQATDVGTYAIWGEIVGTYASSYKLDIEYKTDMDPMTSGDPIDEGSKVSFTINKKNLGTKDYADSSFVGAIYGDDWTFLTDNSWMENYLPMGADCYVNWYYYDNEDKISLVPSTTDAGTYDIYVELLGNAASNFTYAVTHDGDDFPISFTVNPKPINDVIVYYGVKNGGSSALNVYYENYDDEYKNGNSLFYHPDGFPLYAASSSYPEVEITIDGWKEDLTDDEEEAKTIVGNHLYTLYTTGFSCVSGNYFIQAHPVYGDLICKITVENRNFTIYPETYAYYTGSKVAPKFTYSCDQNPGETFTVDPDVFFYTDRNWPGVNLGTAVGSKDELDENYRYGIGISYPDYGYRINSYYTTCFWYYEILPGIPTIEFEQREPWYYKEVVSDITQKLNVTITTNDPNLFPDDQVGINKWAWSVDDGMTWNYLDSDGYPEASDIPAVGGELLFRVETTISTSKNYAGYYKNYAFTIAKAPIYLRSNADLTYAGSNVNQKPSSSTFLYYVYSVDDDNEWSETSHPTWSGVSVPVDDTNGTTARANAGTYPLYGTLAAGLSDNYVFILDEHATFTIKKATLSVSYENSESTYGDSVVFSAPTLTGVGGDSVSALTYSICYGPRRSTYVGNLADEDGSWVDQSERAFNQYSWADAYEIRYMATFANYNSVNVHAVHTVTKRTVSITWSLGETEMTNAAYIADYNSLMSGSGEIYFLASVPYNGVNQIPSYTFGNIVNNDTVNILGWEATKDNGEGVYNVNTAHTPGNHVLQLTSLTNGNYKLPADGSQNVYYKITKATLTVTADDKVVTYGDAAPTYTYTITGFVNGETEADLRAAGKLSGGVTINCVYYAFMSATMSPTIYCLEKDGDPLTADNYNFNYVNGTQTINKADYVGYNVAIKGGDAGRSTYNGNALSAATKVSISYGTMENDPNNVVTITYKSHDADDIPGNWAIAMPSWTNAGSYDVDYKFDNNNYNTVTGTFTFTIDPYVIGYTLLIDGEVRDGNSVTFSGSAHSVTAVLGDKPANASEDDVTIALTGDTSATVAGSYNVTLTLSGEDAENYRFANGENSKVETWGIGVMTITDVSVAQSGTLIYNGSAQQISVSATATTQNDAEYTVWYNTVDYSVNSWSTTAPSYTNAGSYTVYYKITAEGHSPYGATNDAKFIATIEKKELDITWYDYEFIYDGEAHLPSYTLNNICGEDNVSLYFEVGSCRTAADYTFGLDGYSIQPAGEDRTNYKIKSTEKIKMVISRRELTINWTIDEKAVNSVTYNGYEHIVGVTFGNVVAGQTVNPELTANSVTSYIVAGTYTATVKQMDYKAEEAGYDYNYVVSYGAEGSIFRWTIDPKEVVLVWSNDSLTYNSEQQKPTATVDPAYICYGDYVNVTTVTGGQTDYSAEPYTATATALDNRNYKLPADATHTFTIGKAPLTITIKDMTYTYGSVPEEIGLRWDITSGSYFNDWRTDVFTLACDANSLSSVGTYPITLVPGTRAFNYDITSVSNLDNQRDYGIFTVSKRQITVTADNKEKYYGENPDVLTATITGDGIVGNDEVYTLSVQRSGETIAMANKTSAGTYQIVVTLIENANYNVTITHGTYKVKQRPVRLTIQPVYAIYGDPVITEFTATYVAEGNDRMTILDGDEVRYSLRARNLPETPTVGHYAIVGDDYDSNYDVGFYQGAYMVYAKPVSLSWSETAFVYDGQNHRVTATVTNAVGEDVVTVTAYSGATERKNANAEGTYNQTRAITLSNANYTLEQGENVECNWVVNRRSLAVKANNVEATYGEAAKPLTATYNADDLFDAESSVFRLSATRVINETTPVGSYRINVTVLDNDNYAVTIEEGTYVIKRAPITITVNASNTVYGTAFIAPTLENGINVTGWVGSDSIALLSDPLYMYHAVGTSQDFMEFAEDQEGWMNDVPTEAGEYYVVVSFVSGLNNYDRTYGGGKFVIEKKDLTVTAGNKTITYGEAAPVYTATFDGFVENEDVAVLGGELALACVYKQNDGANTYAITLGGYTSNNYEITFVPGTLTVQAKAITVTADNKTSVYGKDLAALTATLSENALVGEDTAASVFALSTTATANANPGEYPITVTVVENANYVVTAVNGTYTITEAAPVVSDDGTKTFNKEISQADAEQGVSVTELFTNAAADTDTAKEVKVEIGNAAIVFDAAAISAIAGKDVTLSVKVDSESTANAPEEAELVIEISLDGATFEAGSVTVSTAFDKPVPEGKVAKVYYVDANGNRTDMNAVFADGKVTFTTHHFSQYIVVFEDEETEPVITPGTPEGNTDTPEGKTDKPEGKDDGTKLSGGAIAGIVIACVVFVAGIAVAVILLLKKKKGSAKAPTAPAKPAPEAKPEEKSDEKTEAKEEKTEEKPSDETKAE